MSDMIRAIHTAAALARGAGGATGPIDDSRTLTRFPIANAFLTQWAQWEASSDAWERLR